MESKEIKLFENNLYYYLNQISYLAQHLQDGDYITITTHSFTPQINITLASSPQQAFKLNVIKKLDELHRWCYSMLCHATIGQYYAIMRDGNSLQFKVAPRVTQILEDVYE